MRIVITLICLLFTSNVIAIDYNTPNHLNLGVNTFYRDYSEIFPPPFKSDESGMLYGLIIGYEHKAPEHFMFAIDFSYAGGNTDYDGSLQTFWGEYVGAHQSTTDNGFATLDTKLGYTFVRRDKHLITPFIGLASNAWARCMLGEFGYDELYSWGNFSLGLQYDYNANKQWQYGLHVKMMPMFHGTMELEDETSGEIILGNKTHLEISAPVIYKHNPCSKHYWRFTPYYQHQSFGESNTVSLLPCYYGTTINEPASRTHIVGLKAEFAIGF